MIVSFLTFIAVFKRKGMSAGTYVFIACKFFQFEPLANNFHMNQCRKYLLQNQHLYGEQNL